MKSANTPYPWHAAERKLYFRIPSFSIYISVVATLVYLSRTECVQLISRYPCYNVSSSQMVRETYCICQTQAVNLDYKGVRILERTFHFQRLVLSLPKISCFNDFDSDIKLFIAYKYLLRQLRTDCDSGYVSGHCCPLASRQEQTLVVTGFGKS